MKRLRKGVWNGSVYEFFDVFYDGLRHIILYCFVQSANITLFYELEG